MRFGIWIGNWILGSSLQSFYWGWVAEPMKSPFWLVTDDLFWRADFPGCVGSIWLTQTRSQVAKVGTPSWVKILNSELSHVSAMAVVHLKPIHPICTTKVPMWSPTFSPQLQVWERAAPVFRDTISCKKASFATCQKLTPPLRNLPRIPGGFNQWRKSGWWFPGIEVPPVIIHFSRIVHYKPSILEYPPF